MVKLFCFAFLQFGILICVYSQSPNVSDHDIIHENYFDLLYGKNHNLNYERTLVKVGVNGTSDFFITTNSAVKEYFKAKYNIKDSSAEKMSEIFLRSEGKIPPSDSTVFATIHMQPIHFYPDTILNVYRKMNLLDFLNEYFPIPQKLANIMVVAYLYEKRMFFDWRYEMLSAYTTDLLRSSKKIQFNRTEKRWESIQQ